MSMLKGLLILFCILQNSYAKPLESPNLGQPVDTRLIKLLNRDIFPDGKGLPAGSGTSQAGRLVYQHHCVACHGVDGTGDSADELAGAQHVLTDEPPDKVIGIYWPYATTIFDFIRRSMPMHKPGVLSNDELYAVTAYLLHLNGIISEKQKINSKTLPLIKMPNRNGFINVYQSEK